MHLLQEGNSALSPRAAGMSVCQFIPQGLILTQLSANVGKEGSDSRGTRGEVKMDGSTSQTTSGCL